MLDFPTFLLLFALAATLLAYARLRFNIRREAMKIARKMYDRWVRERLVEEEKRIRAKYESMLAEWEREIRRDAIERSLSVILGKVSEQLAPLLAFTRLGLDPRDLRFLGSPVDYVAFRGLSSGRVEEILFIEVKAGRRTGLTAREKAVKEAVEKRRVKWVTINLYDAIEEAARKAHEDAKRLVEETSGVGVGLWKKILRKSRG